MGDRVAELRKSLMEAARGGGPRRRQVPGYEVLRTLGRGALGTVHLARNQRDGHFVALKWVHTDDGAEELLREAEITTQLHHPHIVEVVANGKLPGAGGGADVFVAMEYCPGGDLQQLIRRRGGTLPVDEALVLTRQALSALDYAHNASIEIDDCTSCGVVHCDLKPANFLITVSPHGGPHLKIADFGLAQVAGTGAGEAFGTLPFMAREQLDGSASEQTDVFGLAATLYFALTGATARDFGELSPTEVVRTRSSVPIAQRRSGLPPRLCQSIDRALADELDVRFASVAEFANAIDLATS